VQPADLPAHQEGPPLLEVPAVEVPVQTTKLVTPVLRLTEQLKVRADQPTPVVEAVLVPRVMHLEL
jgi:hypothetical protein